ncbi:MAG: PIG-L family deacetylase [bacterium]|nr:PIG-L family deacetylase [bacterium]
MRTTTIWLLNNCMPLVGMIAVSACRATEPSPTAAPAGPRVLCVQAHPDDETSYAATLYKIATHMGGTCDIVLITNGEGGFKYSTLAESLYGAELTDEAVGRAELPAIRKREMRAGADLLEVADIEFLDQTDHRYSQDPREVLGRDADVWDLEWIGSELDRVLARGYDFVFTMAPTPETHGHHQAATVLALRAVKRMPELARPVVLCARPVPEDELEAPFTPGLDAYGVTRVRADAGPFDFDRTQPFGHRGRLDYRIVVNWVIAAHKSQGTMQLAMNRGARERFWLFDLDVPGAVERTQFLFDALAEPQFETKTYEASAGTNAGSQ